MKDYLGRELNIGDKVAFSTHKAHTIGVGHIDHFGTQMVVLDVTIGYNNKVVPMGEGRPYGRAICRYPGDVVKVEDSGRD